MKQYKKIVESPVKVFPRRWVVDGRGSLAEIMRKDGPEYNADFAQIYCTTVRPRIIKGLHLHEKQTDRLMLLRGLVRFVGIKSKPHKENTSYTSELYSLDWMLEDTICLDLIVSDRDPCLIQIPPGIWHAFQNVGTDEAVIVNAPDQMYNYDKPDEIRTDPHSPNIGFDWNICLDG